LEGGAVGVRVGGGLAGSCSRVLLPTSERDFTLCLPAPYPDPAQPPTL